MKNSNSNPIPEDEKYRFKQFVQKTQEETLRVQSFLESLENESSVKNSLIQSRSNLNFRSTDSTKVKIEDLDQEIFNLQNKILDQKKQICQQRSNDQNSLRKLKILEQTYQNAQQKFNAAVSKNRLIRESIDELRKNQKIFKDLCKGLQVTISESKQRMEEMTDIGLKTRKNREFAETQINDLESQAASEEKDYKKSINHLKALIKKEKSLKTEIGMITLHSSSTPNLRHLINDEADIKKKIIRTSWKIAQNKADMVSSINKLEEYELIIKKFQDLAGVSNYESLLNHYLKTKAHNETLAKYVEGLTLEMQQLENQLVEVKKKVNSYKELGNDEIKEQRKESSEAVKEGVEQQEYKKMKRMVEETFLKIGCRDVKDFWSLSEYEMVVMQVKEIENRCHEIIDISTGFKNVPESRYKSSYKIEVEIPAFQDKEKDSEEEDGYLTWQDFGKESKKNKKKKLS